MLYKIWYGGPAAMPARRAGQIFFFVRGPIPIIKANDFSLFSSGRAGAVLNVFGGPSLLPSKGRMENINQILVDFGILGFWAKTCPK